MTYKYRHGRETEQQTERINIVQKKAQTDRHLNADRDPDKSTQKQLERQASEIRQRFQR